MSQYPGHRCSSLLTNHRSQQENFYWIACIDTSKCFKDGKDKSDIFVTIVNVSREILETLSLVIRLCITINKR